MKSICTTLVVVATLAGCATYPETDFVGRLGTDATLGGGSYTSGGGVTVAVDVMERNGRTVVCGAWAESRHQSGITQGATRRVLPTGSIFVGRDRVFQNLLAFKEVEPQSKSSSYAGTEANCYLTDRAWKAAYATTTPKVRIPRQVVERDSGDASTGSATALSAFVQDGPGAHR